jgi:hypothetical protein
MGYLIMNGKIRAEDGILHTDEESPSIMYLSLPDMKYKNEHKIQDEDDMPDHRWLHITIGFN